MGVFNEQKLREEIIKIWGEYGAHIEVYDMLLKKANIEIPKSLNRSLCIHEGCDKKSTCGDYCGTHCNCKKK